MPEFTRGYVTTEHDTEVFFYVDAILQDPQMVTFAVYDMTVSPEVVVGVPDHPARRIGTGHWYARFEVPRDAAFGDYKLVYSYIEVQNGTPVTKAVELPFQVVATTEQTEFTSKELQLIEDLRVILRDNNPDAYYRFAPPNPTKRIMGFTKEKGYIWQDDELLRFLKIAANNLQNYWFGTGVTLGTLEPKHEGLVLYEAAFLACQAEAIRWVSEEFEYDLNGVSLSINRSDKFSSMAGVMKETMNSMLEGAAQNSKATKGVKGQFGVSRGAALGPRVSGAPVLNYIRSGRRGRR